jgi:phage baseplate assembly protein W
MIGMHKDTGKPLSGLEHLRQRVENILRTAPATLVILREYGSELFGLIDAPTSAAVRARFVAATAGALDRWEPELKTTRVLFDLSNSEQVRGGHVSISLEGYYMPTGEPVVLEGIQIS